MCPRRGRVFAVVSAQVTPGDKADKIFARVEQPDTLAGGQCAQMLCLFSRQYRKFVISDKVKLSSSILFIHLSPTCESCILSLIV